MPKNQSQPDSFLDVEIHELDLVPSFSGLCAGFESGAWRAPQLADHLMEWLLEFALTPSEYETMGTGNAVSLMRRAANSIYRTDKFRNRGEFGELILHAAVRQVFESLPAVSKIYYKSSDNDTVKGFDAVHVVGPPDDLELWLGEAKFYTDAGLAVRHVLTELKVHLEAGYLRREFALILNKIDPRWPQADVLKRLLSRNTSLDQVFKRICIPVLLTYDSKCLAESAACDKLCREAVIGEMRAVYDQFSSGAGGLPGDVRCHLFLLPLNTKKLLIEALDGKLRVWQQI